MSDSLAKAETTVIVLVGIAALFVGYKIYSTGRSAAGAVGGVIDAAGELVGDAAAAAGNAVTRVARGAQNAYAEVATIVTGQVHYSPEALDSSMSREDAIALADDIAQRNKELDAAQYQLMADMESQRLVKRYPASAESDPSLPYFGYSNL